MPRVNRKKKSTRGESYGCVRCSNKIVAGQEYYEWSFRYGGTSRQHVDHGSPRPSQLTQSKMSAAHAACEDLEDQLGNLDTVSDIEDAVQSCMDSIQEVMDEYEEAINNMPASEEQNRERIDQLQETYDALDNAKDYGGEDLEEFDEDSVEREEEETDEAFEERVAAEKERVEEENEGKLQEYRDAITDAAAERSF
jgi:chromosome segregation ATPase